MTTYYVIQDVNSNGFWSTWHRKFKGWLYANKFDTYEAAEEEISKENVGVCKITKIYDSK